MSDYSDIIYITAAMVIFSMLTINTGRSFQFTQDALIRADLEYRAIALAQDEIDAIRWFEREDLFDSDDNDYLYGDDPIQKTVVYGDENQYSETFTLTRNSIHISDDSNGNERYRIVINVTSDALSPGISGTLEFIKTFED